MGKPIVQVDSVKALLECITEAQTLTFRQTPRTPRQETAAEWEGRLRKVPLALNLARFTNFAYRPISALFKLADGIKLPPTIGVISPYLALAVGILDFLYIPFLAFSSWAADPEAKERSVKGFYKWLKSDRCPLNYTHLGRMAATTFFIGAVVTIITAGFAPIMLTVISSIGFVVAASTLVKAVIWNRRYKKELSNIPVEQAGIIQNLELLKKAIQSNQVQSIHDLLTQQCAQYAQLRNPSQDDIVTHNLLQTLVFELQHLKDNQNLPPKILSELGQYVQTQQNKRLALQDRAAFLQKEIGRTGMGAIVYKTGMMMVSAASVAGFALLLVPGLNLIGISLIAASAVISGLVVIGRAMDVLWKNYLKEKWNNFWKKPSYEPLSQEQALNERPPKPGLEQVTSSSYDRILAKLNWQQPADVQQAAKHTVALLGADLNHKHFQQYVKENPALIKALEQHQHDDNVKTVLTAARQYCSPSLRIKQE